VTRRQNALWASAVAAGLMLTVSACGGSGTAASPKTEGAVMLGEQLTGMVSQVEKMGIVEWHGQLLTKNPDKGGERIYNIDGRYSPSTGYSELSMDSAVDGNVQQIDYLVVNDRAYFNSENWGPGAANCWSDITGDAARTWGLPTELDPSWPLTVSRAIGLDGDDVDVAIALKPVLAGLPRGLFTSTPAVPYDTEAEAVISPHGHLIEVGVDIQSMWKDAPKSAMADFDTRSAGWWAMTMKESPNGKNIVPPAYVFDPKVTPPSQCKR
jgi:hypothetical protein